MFRTVRLLERKAVKACLIEGSRQTLHAERGKRSEDQLCRNHFGRLFSVRQSRYADTRAGMATCIAILQEIHYLRGEGYNPGITTYEYAYDVVASYGHSDGVRLLMQDALQWKSLMHEEGFRALMEADIIRSDDKAVIATVEAFRKQGGYRSASLHTRLRVRYCLLKVMLMRRDLAGAEKVLTDAEAYDEIFTDERSIAVAIACCTTLDQARRVWRRHTALTTEGPKALLAYMRACHTREEADIVVAELKQSFPEVVVTVKFFHNFAKVLFDVDPEAAALTGIAEVIEDMRDVGEEVTEWLLALQVRSVAKSVEKAKARGDDDTVQRLLDVAHAAVYTAQLQGKMSGPHLFVRLAYCHALLGNYKEVEALRRSVVKELNYVEHPRLTKTVQLAYNRAGIDRTATPL